MVSSNLSTREFSASNCVLSQHVGNVHILCLSLPSHWASLTTPITSEAGLFHLTVYLCVGI